MGEAPTTSGGDSDRGRALHATESRERDPQDRRHGPFAPCPIPPSMGQLMGISLKLATWPIFWEIPQSFHNFIQPFPLAEIFLGEKSLPLPPDVATPKREAPGNKTQICFPTTT